MGYEYNPEWKRGQAAPVKMGTVSFDVFIPLVVGDFEIKDVDVYAVYKGERVTQIPLGSGFEVHADYMILNKIAGFWDFWSTSMTVYDMRTETPVASDDFGDHRGGSWLDAHDAINAVIGHEQALYRVKIFANHEHGAGSPPKDLWR